MQDPQSVYRPHDEETLKYLSLAQSILADATAHVRLRAYKRPEEDEHQTLTEELDQSLKLARLSIALACAAEDAGR